MTLNSLYSHYLILRMIIVVLLIPLETYDERLQATDIELPCLNEPPNVEENSDDKTTEKSGPLYPVIQRIDFKIWKELTE
ncbi:26299_t:CDS:2 [Racocetra persica]|uniref:26299_t:CDS:1 n=1 Tax=Racocetra persica TaxID=160502 RepID=A0ACA9KXM0_9GLOM|nr:26299_t:CDS:2 [Racocetra persica]